MSVGKRDRATAGAFILTEENLPEDLQAVSKLNVSPIQLPLPEQGISLEAVERELISHALAKFDGSQTHAARYLDISRRTLIYRIEKYGLLTGDESF